ncbi:MAG: uroporphyrinogen-III synthase [Acidobacteriota bacterium]|nr:uroporphyrinogen-III synthase [Acidobacteriota bacterium]MDE3043211.1 uroporphyrinogen-III synthase [Acidobacteriota bacterium]MDE3106533.1 uroporphyrinogen-III synthase [Acidobacteriota bacterium]MDE3222621.1 uroporphyrinogen-III synthase [Acidobacteriota bacterium]
MIRVALTREEGANDRLRDFLDESWDVVEVPATQTSYLSDDVFDASLHALDLATDTPWLVATSARGARYVARAVRTLKVTPRVACVGARTAQAVEALSTHVDLVGEAGAAALAPFLDGEVVIVGALERRDELAQLLRSRDVKVVDVTCYETVARELSPSEQLALGASDVVFVGAPSAWRVLRPWVAHDTLVVVPGATTAEEVGARYEVLQGWDDALRGRLASWARRREGTRESEQ